MYNWSEKKPSYLQTVGEVIRAIGISMLCTKLKKKQLIIISITKHVGVCCIDDQKS